jgi:hypothetical protein
MLCRFQAVFLAALVWLPCLVRSASAAELKQKTIEAFEQYVHASESRMAEDLQSQSTFMWIERMPGPSRDIAYAKLREGQIEIKCLGTRQDQRAIQVPDGLVHHWVGVVFIPGATLERTLAILQDYDRHQVIYAPYVRRSQLLRRDGNEFRVFLQFYRKAIITVVLNAEFRVTYTPLQPGRMQSRAYSTRIAEVSKTGEHGEQEKPIGTGRGLLWRLNTYSRLQETTEGVYFQLEVIALTRRVPRGLGWLINPFIERIPKESLTLLLSATRKAVLGEKKTVGAPVHPTFGFSNRCQRLMYASRHCS